MGTGGTNVSVSVGERSCVLTCMESKPGVLDVSQDGGAAGCGEHRCHV